VEPLPDDFNFSAMSVAERTRVLMSEITLGGLSDDAAAEIAAMGVNTSAWNAAGDALLHIAARRELPRLATVLLDAGARTDGISEAGLTPLMLAVRHGSIRMFDLLAQRGADHNLRGPGRATAFTLAARAEGGYFAAQLLERGVPDEDFKAALRDARALENYWARRALEESRPALAAETEEITSPSSAPSRASSPLRPFGLRWQ
jgi:ankyrin repeat protein